MKILKFLVAFTILLSGCGKAPVPPAKPLVLVSIAPYKFLAEKIGRNEVEVELIVPPHANPHAFEPTLRQVAAISNASVWFRIGEPFEEKILATLKKKIVVCDLRENIPLLEDPNCHCSRDSLDRHIWLSPKLALIQAEAMERILSEKFPEKEEIFKKNLALLRGELELLDREIGSLLQPVSHRTFLVSHSAFGYFCRDYGVEQLSIEEEGKEPRPKYVEEILQKAKERNAKFALILPQHSNKGAELIARRLHLPVIQIDPYSEDYVGMMKQLAKSLAGESP